MEAVRGEALQEALYNGEAGVLSCRAVWAAGGVLQRRARSSQGTVGPAAASPPRASVGRKAAASPREATPEGGSASWAPGTCPCCCEAAVLGCRDCPPGRVSISTNRWLTPTRGQGRVWLPKQPLGFSCGLHSHSRCRPGPGPAVLCGPPGMSWGCPSHPTFWVPRRH